MDPNQDSIVDSSSDDEDTDQQGLEDFDSDYDPTDFMDRTPIAARSPTSVMEVDHDEPVQSNLNIPLFAPNQDASLKVQNSDSPDYEKIIAEKDEQLRMATKALKEKNEELESLRNDWMLEKAKREAAELEVQKSLIEKDHSLESLQKKPEAAAEVKKGDRVNLQCCESMILDLSKMHKIATLSVEVQMHFEEKSYLISANHPDDADCYIQDLRRSLCLLMKVFRRKGSKMFKGNTDPTISVFNGTCKMYAPADMLNKEISSEEQMIIASDFTAEELDVLNQIWPNFLPFFRGFQVTIRRLNEEFDATMANSHNLDCFLQDLTNQIPFDLCMGNTYKIYNIKGMEEFYNEGSEAVIVGNWDTEFTWGFRKKIYIQKGEAGMPFGIVIVNICHTAFRSELSLHRVLLYKLAKKLGIDIDSEEETDEQIEKRVLKKFEMEFGLGVAKEIPAEMGQLIKEVSDSLKGVVCEEEGEFERVTVSRISTEALLGKFIENENLRFPMLPVVIGRTSSGRIEMFSMEKLKIRGGQTTEIPQFKIHDDEFLKTPAKQMDEVLEDIRINDDNPYFKSFNITIMKFPKDHPI